MCLSLKTSRNKRKIKKAISLLYTRSSESDHTLHGTFDTVYHKLSKNCFCTTIKLLEEIKEHYTDLTRGRCERSDNR